MKTEEERHIRLVLWMGISIFLGMIGLAIVMTAITAEAGCIGPVIAGECEGGDVPWDTHTDCQIRQDAPIGTFWDKRGTEDAEDFPNAINPFTGQDAHDSNWFESEGKWGIKW